LAEERLLGNCLSPRVKRRKLQFFERLRPPGRNETPSHGHEPALAVLAIVSIVVVGQTLYRACVFTGGCSNVSRYSLTISSHVSL
jgi:hypothetical protein